MLANDSSDALILLPGLMCDGTVFAGQLARFPGARAVDRFYGGARSLAAMAEHVLAQMPERASLLGHSMGARVALEVVRRAPERVTRLALADTGVHPVRPGEARQRLALSDIGGEHGITALVEAWLPPMLAPQARSDEALMASLRAMCLRAGMATWDAQVAALLSRPEVESLLPTIRCPTLVLVGRLDCWSPPEQHEVLAAAIPGAMLRVIEGAGHMAPVERPAEFSHAIAEWLALPAT